MKVVLAIGSLSAGGAERVLSSLANHWSKEGHDVTVYTLSTETKDHYGLANGIRRSTLDRAIDPAMSGFKRNFWGSRSVRAFFAIRNLLHARKKLLAEQPDAVISFITHTNVVCGLLFLGTNIRVIGCEQNHPPLARVNLLWHILRRLIYPRLEHVTALTSDSCLWLKKHTKPKHLTVIPNPVSYPLPNLEPFLDVEQVLKNLNGENLIIGVGRLVAQKNFGRLIEAFAELNKIDKSWQLVILGEGPLRRSLEKQVEAGGLSNFVTIPGIAGNIADWYEAAELLVVTSEYEGFPLTIVEALAYGCPVISVDCETGPSDILRHEIDGLLVDKDCPRELVDALLRLTSQPSVRDEMSRKAIEAIDRFSISVSANQYKELVLEINIHD